MRYTLLTAKGMTFAKLYQLSANDSKLQTTLQQVLIKLTLTSQTVNPGLMKPG